MRSVTKSYPIDASADRLWALLSTKDGQRRCEADIADAVVFEGEGVGMIRTIHLAEHMGGGVIRERLEQFDPAVREMTFRMIEAEKGFPVENYCGSAKAIAVAPSKSTLALRATFSRGDLSEEDAYSFIELSCDQFAGAVANILAPDQ